MLRKKYKNLIKGTIFALSNQKLIKLIIMRKQINYGILGFAIVSMIVTGCSKDDTTAPSIALSGSTDETIILPLTAGGNGTYTDPGFVATDEEDGTITAKVSVSGLSDVNLNRKGVYTITYSVSDEAGNSASATRTVRVVNEAEVFAGAYVDAIDSSTITGVVSIFDANVVTSDTVNNLVRIYNFGAFGDTIGLYANFAGTTPGSAITMPVPQAIIGTSTLTAVFPSGSEVVANSTGTQTFTVYYQYNDGGNLDTILDTFTR